MTPTPTAVNTARDWAEIQERMLVPLYEAVYDRLELGPGDRVLGLDCGAGLSLLLAAGRGARVTGVEPRPALRALARERVLEVLSGPPESSGRPYDLLTAFAPAPGALAAALPRVRRGGAVVLAGWGPPERCTVPAMTDPGGAADLDGLVERAGLSPEGSGRVFCPFGYAEVGSAVRGLLSTGLYDLSDPGQAEKELAEELHPYERPDGTVWLPNIFRYVVARVA
ncbi:methyltransferase type 11 [Streptomyces venezuelae]|uniref:Methyltransferase type 11 n=1 Tax=Streptomyces venezuelae TaxID=54571 RepID=A0A5P2CYR7_STRVZ|nr:methyltransferase type 11 [Streptomyces venezuelae]QES48005.1 methyltransferase type 11 [Streptomyces venezuelae]